MVGRVHITCKIKYSWNKLYLGNNIYVNAKHIYSSSISKLRNISPIVSYPSVLCLFHWMENKQMFCYVIAIVWTNKEVVNAYNRHNITLDWLSVLAYLQSNLTSYCYFCYPVFLGQKMLMIFHLSEVMYHIITFFGDWLGINLCSHSENHRDFLSAS